MFWRLRCCAIHYKYHSCLRTLNGGFGLKAIQNLLEASPTVVNMLLSFKRAVLARGCCVSSYVFDSESPSKTM